MAFTGGSQKQDVFKMMQIEMTHHFSLSEIIEMTKGIYKKRNTEQITALYRKVKEAKSRSDIEAIFC